MCLNLKKGSNRRGWNWAMSRKKRKTTSQKAGAGVFSSWVILTGASRGFLWQTVWPQDCWQKRMLYLNTFRLHALLNTTEIGLYYEWGPPQPTSNISLLVGIKTTTQKEVLSGATYYRFRRKAILIFLQGIFSNDRVINSFSQIAYSISRTWIPNKVLGFMWHTQVKGSNNCYGERWKKKNGNINMRSVERLVVR